MASTAPKKETTTVANANVQTGRTFEYTKKDAEVAEQLGIMVEAPVEDRITRAVVSYNMAARLAVEAGYLLLSVKASVAHGEFGAVTDAMGLSRYRAAELMRMAKFTTTLPPERREEMLVMPKQKVLALASADPQVVEELLHEGEDADLNDLSVRDLRARLREMQAKVANAGVERQQAEAETEKLRKRLNKQENNRSENAVPEIVKNMRAEIGAMVKKAELSIDGVRQIFDAEITSVADVEGVGAWIEPTAQLGLAGLVALRIQLDGCINALTQQYNCIEVIDNKPDMLASLSPDEMLAAAQHWSVLTQSHAHEAALRKHERESSKPRTRGRPKSAPKNET